jgi:ABC-2 type transport system ATP-binding protein
MGLCRNLELPEGVQRDTRADGMLALTYRRSQVSAGQLLAAVAAAGGAISDVSSEDPNLEDVFLALTAGADPAPISA